MKYVNVTILTGADNASHNGSQIDANQLISASFQAVFGSADAAGTVKIQMSNQLPTNISQDFVVTQWSDIPNATSTVTSGACAPITINTMAYRFIRAVFTRSGGGASNKTVTVQMFSQSV